MAQKIIEYDFAGWRKSLGWSTQQACETLGCSRAHLWKLEKRSEGPAVYAWACFGILVHHEENQE